MRSCETPSPGLSSLNQMNEIDFVKVIEELQTIQQHILNKNDKDADSIIVLGELAKAEKACKNNDKSELFKSLKIAGEKALDFANCVSANVVAELIKNVL